MRRFLAQWLVIVPVLTGVLQAQVATTPTCSDSLAKTMAFLEGDWEGRSYSVSGRDTVLDARMTVHSQRLFGGCALEERWEAANGGQILFTARVVRAYDASAQRWSVYYVDNQLNSQIYEGRREGAEWRFLRTRLDKGVPIHVRLTWRPTPSGYDQLIERSRDGGTTWVPGGFVTFRSARSR
ncbi:MAG TPA: hypothetical protein VIG08_11705 [Gemmatimonadales bacterium]|jgi:hypothetical protein